MSNQNVPAFQKNFYMLTVNGKPGWMAKDGMIYYSDLYHPVTIFLTRAEARIKIFYCKKKREKRGFDADLNFGVRRAMLAEDAEHKEAK